MASARVLRVRCTTWEQVEAFYRKKLRKNGRLSMKVPFECEVGTPVTLGLELPNQIVIAIDGTVASLGATTGGRTSIDVTLFGLSSDLLARLKALVGDARATTADEEGLDDERKLLVSREADLRRKRLLAVHEIVGVPRDPSAVELRAAWIALASREHPDAVARYASPTLTSVAEETMILAARAYDRLRASVVEAKRGHSVGPSVRPPASWAASDEAVNGFLAEAVTPPIDDAVELMDVSAVHRLPTTEQMKALDEAMVRSAAADAAAARAKAAAAAAAADAAAAAEIAAGVDVRPSTEPPPLPALDELLPAPVIAPVAAPATSSGAVRWSDSSDLFSDLDLGSGPVPTGSAPIAFEDSLAQGRAGPGDRFVRQIRARLAAGDHYGAKEMAEAALHLYSGDRRLRGLLHVAAAMSAAARADKTGAIAALETALASDPSCLEAATALEQLRRVGIPSAPAIQRLFS